MTRTALAVLVAIVLGALGLRVHALDRTPPGLYLDEASVGVNAVALAASGRDQDGVRAPVLFRALDDWKHPLVVYGAAASVRALGPTPFAVRLPSALFGTLTVLLLGLLVLELTENPAEAIASAFVLALTPWHVHYSRMAWEAASLGLTVVLALWLHARARRRGGARRFALAGAALGLVAYSYTPAKLLLPAFLVALATIELREGLAARRRAARVVAQDASAPAPLFAVAAPALSVPTAPVPVRGALALALALALVAGPMVVFQVEHFAAIQHRFEAVSVFREPEPLRALATSYLAHLSPRFLFLEGDVNPRHGWGRGELLLATAPLVALGILRALGRRDAPALLQLAWLAIYPLGACLTSEGVPHASRSFLAAPLFAWLAGSGLALALDRAGSRRGRLVVGALALALVAGEGAASLRDYFREYSYRTARSWCGGVAETLAAIEGRPEVVARVHVAAGNGLVREHVLFFAGQGAVERYRWLESTVSLPRFVAALPPGEVVLARPEQLPGSRPLFVVSSVGAAFGVYGNPKSR